MTCISNNFTSCFVGFLLSGKNSRVCANKLHKKILGHSINLKHYIQTDNFNYTRHSRLLGQDNVTNKAVRKNIKIHTVHTWRKLRLGLLKPIRVRIQGKRVERMGALLIYCPTADFDTSVVEPSCSVTKVS
jgi:hypothetical protein